jgi:hypothetical protein
MDVIRDISAINVGGYGLQGRVQFLAQVSTFSFATTSRLVIQCSKPIGDLRKGITSSSLKPN